MYNIVDNLEEKKKRIYFLFVTDFINNNDIERLVNSSINDLIYNKDSYKSHLLLSIYINPYLLCNDYLINIDNINVDLISKLVIKRYNEEITEYNNLYNNGDISYLEYSNNVMILNNLYFNSTKIGNRIRLINSEDIVEKVKIK